MAIKQNVNCHSHCIEKGAAILINIFHPYSMIKEIPNFTKVNKCTCKFLSSPIKTLNPYTNNIPFVQHKSFEYICVSNFDFPEN